MSTINSRISALIQHFGLNPTSFSTKIGLSNNVTIGNIVGGIMNKPSYDTLEKIILTFNSINIDWLMTGHGKMLKQDTTAPLTVTEPVPDNIHYNMYKDMLKDKDAVIKEKDAKIEELNSEINRLNRENGILQGQLKKPTGMYSNALSMEPELVSN